ncbi:hypothetical protein I131_07750 [Enterococcus faecium CRL1879]|nr:hypothetical protein I131_07750 [Enterococcus faecium CRL1879]
MFKRASEIGEKCSKEQKSRLIYSLRKTFKLKEILKVTGFPKATYYYWVNCFERVNKDELIEKEMLKIGQEHANAGYRPMSELLKQRGYITSTTRRYNA